MPSEWMDGVYHLEDNKNIRRGRVAHRRKFTGSALLISQSSGKDKPPSIDAAIEPNEHGRARDAASVTHDTTHAAPIPLREVKDEMHKVLRNQRVQTYWIHVASTP
jgi:hypothetical protein